MNDNDPYPIPPNFRLAAITLMSLAAIVILTVLVGVWAIKASITANAYNAVTGKHVTTWQAMWVDLRIQEPAK